MEPPERARAFGLISAMFAAGMVFGPFGGGLLYARFGFAAPFLAAAALQLVTLVLTITMLPESRGKDKDAERVGFGSILQTFRNPRLGRILWQKLAGLARAVRMVCRLRALPRAPARLFADADRLPILDLFGLQRLRQRRLGRAYLRELGNRSMSNVGLTFLVAGFALVPLVHGVRC